MAMGGDVSRVTAITANQAVKADVSKTFDNYAQLFNDADGSSSQRRNENYMKMVNDFYNMVTDFYEFGWGHSFHFAPRHKWETFAASIARSEMYIAHKLNLQPGQVAVDLGCGVGGPGRCVARFSGAQVVGVNNNEYQLSRARKHTAEQGLNPLCSYLQADFMHLPVDDNTYNAAFHFEALEHSPDRVGLFKEIFRVLKPGGLFTGYDWVITDKCDMSNPQHVLIKKGIELGNGLPDLQRPRDLLEAMKEAGFEILESRDIHSNFDPNYDIPWYDSLEGKYWNLSNFKHTPWGRWLTNKMVLTLETLRFAPKGTLKVHNMLCKVADELVASGRLGIFSPSFFYVARKPSH